MANFLLCSSPIYGHVAPVLAIGAELVGRGHRVRMLTGRRFEDAVSAAGLEFVALAEECDYDDRDLDVAFPGRAAKKGIAKLRFDVDNVFVEAMEHQDRSLREVLADGSVDAVLAETAFVGVLPLLLGARSARPPIFGCGVLPMPISSRDTAPFGLGLPPSTTPLGRLRNRALNALVQRVVLGGNQRRLNLRLHKCGAPSVPVFFMDSPYHLEDRVFQLTCPGFEYPRSDLPATITFAGAVLPRAHGTFEPPPWWDDLTTRTVVHVSQGTIDNADLHRLIVPTLRALADLDVLIVATTGGRPVTDLPADLPENARVAEFVPYDQLLPKIDVMITNGGYGGVQFALAHGVPLVVAGDSEDKPDVAARTAWSGAGINLKTGKPKPVAIRTAVDKILATPSYTERARSLAAEFSGLSARDIISDALERSASD